MKIINVHQREYGEGITTISEILDSLSSKNDRLWPNEIWPPMKLNDGLEINSSGGHGPISYYVSQYDKGKSIEFTFTRPVDFKGTHAFEIIEKAENTILLRHTIDMTVNLKGFLMWYLAIKWLHDALLEDCLDKVHNQLNEIKVQPPHNFWVNILRNILRSRKT